MEFYDLYCKGYSFLQELGLGYGLSVVVPRVQNTKADSWDELTEQQQKDLLESFSPGLEEEIERVINWIDKKKIILTGKQDNLDHYEYNDLRTEEEKISKLSITVSEEKQANKKWWKIWK